MFRPPWWSAVALAWLLAAGLSSAAEPPWPHPVGSWVKLTPLAETPVSPRLGYEGDCVWDPLRQVFFRYGGHNQGGGGEQGSEVWTFDPRSRAWKLYEPNTSPPGVCCAQQNLFAEPLGRYLRFSAASGGHGWQWFREIYLNDSSVWLYDLAANRWTDRRPLPTPRPRLLRCASWDSEFEAAVMFGGEGSNEGTWTYVPYTNHWTEKKPARQPAGRSGGNMAYDPEARLHVLFGAQFQDDPHTWVYDLRRNEWRTLDTTGSPPTDRNDAQLCYDPVARRVLAVLRIASGEGDDAQVRLETWGLDVAAARWTKLEPPQEPDPSGSRARQLMFAPELGVALLENSTRPIMGQQREQQVWAYRPQPSTAAPLASPPSGLRATIADGAVSLAWEAPAAGGPAIVGWSIERAVAPEPWGREFAELARLEGAAGRQFRDPTPPRHAVYAVRAVQADGRLGQRSQLARLAPPVVEDIVVSVLSAERVEIAWRPPAGAAESLRYELERAAVEVHSDDELRRLTDGTPPLEQPSVGAIRRIGAFVSLVDRPLEQLQFVDTALDLRKPATVEGPPLFERNFHRDDLVPDGRPYRFGVYAYRVRAVNALGEAGGWSPAAFTFPSSPQHVFAREEGEKLHLKWQAGGEQSLAGYRVYRMDGRYLKDTVSRLHAEPITATEWTDDEPGRGTKRYYVVAVDALGQEGRPSAPAWRQREWAPFYEPFVGPWHQ